MEDGPAGHGEPLGRGSADAKADAALEKMGYKGELPRHLGMMSVLGLYVLIALSLFIC